MHNLIKIGCVVAATVGASLASRGEALCAGESEVTAINLASGTRTSAVTERIWYSADWVNGAGSGATVIVEVDGIVLSSATGSGFVDWEPQDSGRTYTLTHKVMSGGTQIGETLTAVFVVNGTALCAGESEMVGIDLSTGTRTAVLPERICYSVGWVDGAGADAVAVVEVNGETLNSVVGSGYVDWTPMSNGTYTLTHKVMSGGVQVGETLTATFLAAVLTATQTTEVPVPYSWLRQYCPEISDEYEAYEAAAKATAANGYNRVWECYVAGISPTNETAKFTAAIEMVDGVPQITWSPNLNRNGIERTYTIWGKTNLMDGVEWECPTNSAHRFFKVTVEMP